MTQYETVWQTWSVVTDARASSTRAESDCAQGTQAFHDDFRLRLQIARIERRWSIADLAQRVRCATEVLASYERGEDVVSADLRRRLVVELDL